MKLLILAAALLATPAAAQSGWALSVQPAAAALVHGTPGASNAFRLDCSANGTSITAWAPRAPRGVSEGEFPTRLGIFQGNTEVDLGATARVQPGGGVRMDALVDNPPAFLQGMGRQSRLVAVHFAGRSMAPAPSAAQLADFSAACARKP